MNKVKLIDGHNHYNNEAFENDYKILIENHQKDGIFINVVGTNILESLKAIDLANKYDNVVCSVGLHPDNHYDDLDVFVNEFEKKCLIDQKKVVAIGECGLDYYYNDNPSHEKQKALLIKQILLAIKYQLPLMLHIRDAHNDAYEILKQYYQQLPVIIIHCFHGNCDDVLKYRSLNCYISFSGMVTFKKNEELRKCVSLVDLDYLLSETDCPFLSPEPLRGKRNDSNNLIYINQCLATIKKIDLKEMNKFLNNNIIKALKLYKYNWEQ